MNSASSSNPGLIVPPGGCSNAYLEECLVSPAALFTKTVELDAELVDRLLSLEVVAILPMTRRQFWECVKKNSPVIWDQLNSAVIGMGCAADPKTGQLFMSPVYSLAKIRKHITEATDGPFSLGTFMKQTDTSVRQMLNANFKTKTPFYYEEK